MNVLLVFEAKYLNQYNNGNDPLTVQVSVNIFLHYCLGLLQHHHPHQREQMVQFVKRCYINQRNVTSSGTIVDLQTGHVYEDNVAETILEVIEVLERYYLNEVLGALHELSVEYGITQLQFHRLTRFNLLVSAKCVYTLPAPPA